MDRQARVAGCVQLHPYQVSRSEDLIGLLMKNLDGKTTEPELLAGAQAGILQHKKNNGRVRHSDELAQTIVDALKPETLAESAALPSENAVLVGAAQDEREPVAVG